MTYRIENRVTRNALATDKHRLRQLFGDHDDLLPLWIAEPYVELAPAVTETIESRAQVGWFGYETRPDSVIESFWGWATRRHGWDGSSLRTSVSPSVGTSIGVLLDEFTEPGDGVILQPPVFTDFKPLVVTSQRKVVRNSLILTEAGYEMDIDDLSQRAADPSSRMLILCNPHNPVGRLWTPDDLRTVAELCAANDVFVIADEIHADLAFGSHAFHPFALAAAGTGVSWAAIHGPIKTFGVAGVCDTLLIAEDEAITQRFRARSSQLHLTRNNVFATDVFKTVYREGDDWLDELHLLIERNVELLQQQLPAAIDLVEPDATYLAWLDFRQLGLDVPELAQWIATAGLALSPGHWFGREGAGFARMTIAAPTTIITEAINRLTRALQ